MRQQLAGAWLTSLKSERRMAAKTLEAYGRDLRQFGAFLAGFLEGPATAAELARADRCRFSQLHGAAPQ